MILADGNAQELREIKYMSVEDYLIKLDIFVKRNYK